MGNLATLNLRGRRLGGLLAQRVVQAEALRFWEYVTTNPGYPASGVEGHGLLVSADPGQRQPGTSCDKRLEPTETPGEDFPNCISKTRSSTSSQSMGLLPPGLALAYFRVLLPLPGASPIAWKTE